MKTKSILKLIAFLLTFLSMEVVAAVRYVNVNNPTPSAPYLTWATAAASIQAAINAAFDGDVIAVTNGVYQTGGSELFQYEGSNRVSISKALLVQSVNGPAVTIINGGGGLRCVALVSNAVLSGFTLTNGYAPGGDYGGRGGGVMGGPYPSMDATLTNCILTGNAGSASGGGAFRCTLNDCILTNNSNGYNSGGYSGGGAFFCILNNCLITGNRTGSLYGGGADSSTLNHCVVSNNFAGTSGGGTARSVLNNCVIVNNVARVSGGGSADNAVTNCLITGNTATNQGAWGGGAVGAVTDGTPFVNCAFVNNRTPSRDGFGGGIGTMSSFVECYNCRFTNNSAATGGGVFRVWLYDCVLVGNYATNGGGAALAHLERCLVLGNVAKMGGGVFGGYVFHPINGPLTGSAITYRCVITGNSASIAGGGVYGNGEHRFGIFTNNFALDGGAFSHDKYLPGTTFDTCRFSGNFATNRGGAVFGYCDLHACSVVGNSANEGGGVRGDADEYGDYPSVSASIIYHNSAPAYPNCDTNASIGNCCTTPMPADGYDNITNEPAFADVATGEFRLSSNSPCINYIASSPRPDDPEFLDLDGKPRLVGGGIDLGAYEFQNPSSSISYYWLQQRGLPNDGSADYMDPDGDGFNNYSEWRGQTDPFDATSLLRFRNISMVTNSGDPTPLIRLEWQSVPGVYYLLERASNATGPFTNIANYIWADSTNTSWTENFSPTEKSIFYRVGVQ